MYNNIFIFMKNQSIRVRECSSYMHITATDQLIHGGSRLHDGK